MRAQLPETPDSRVSWQGWQGRRQVREVGRRRDSHSPCLVLTNMASYLLKALEKLLYLCSRKDHSGCGMKDRWQ